MYSASKKNKNKQKKNRDPKGLRIVPHDIFLDIFLQENQSEGMNYLPDFLLKWNLCGPGIAKSGNYIPPV